MKITTIVGARPQFVKAAAVSRAIQHHNASIINPNEAIKEVIVHTGQHYDYNMSRVFFEELEIPEPDINLGVGSGNHGQMTGAMLNGIEKLLQKHPPDLLLVYGDTNSTLAGALAAAKLHIPVGHVEAGLRSFNRKMPEEINRVLTDHISELLFCPTETAVANLHNEGVTDGVFNVGDVMYDSVLYFKDRAQMPDIAGPFALSTLHRAENTDNPSRLAIILRAMNDSPIPVVFPLHPRTRKKIAKFQIELGKNIKPIAPLSYLALLGYLGACEYVMTDSGGLQKEAYFFQKKCITLRGETEWVELIKAGANRLVGDAYHHISAAMRWATTPFSAISDLYGHGDAANRIIKNIKR